MESKQQTQKSFLKVYMTVNVPGNNKRFIETQKCFHLNEFTKYHVSL